MSVVHMENRSRVCLPRCSSDQDCCEGSMCFQVCVKGGCRRPICDPAKCMGANACIETQGVMACRKKCNKKLDCCPPCPELGGGLDEPCPACLEGCFNGGCDWDQCAPDLCNHGTPFKNSKCSDGLCVGICSGDSDCAQPSDLTGTSAQKFVCGSDGKCRQSVCSVSNCDQHSLANKWENGMTCMEAVP